MKKIKSLLSQPWAAYTFAACTAVILFIILSNFEIIGKWLSSVLKFLSPIIIGTVSAYLLNPVAVFFRKTVFKKTKKENTAHIWSVVLTVVCLLLVLAVLLTALIPSLAQSVSKLVSNWDSYTQKIQTVLEKAAQFAAQKNINIDISKISDIVDNSMAELVELLKTNVKSILSAIGNIGTSVSNFAIGILFGICFLLAKRSLLAFLAKIRSVLFKADRLERNNELWRRFNSVFIRYVGCTLLDAAIIGVGTLIFMLIMRLPYAALIAAVAGITNIIPTFGPMIGGAIGVFFLILDKPINALWFFIFICIWQSIDGMIIKPKLFSDSLGISGVWTLVLILLGGKIAGMMGILLSIPLAAVLVIFYHESIAPKLDKRIEKINSKAPPETDDGTQT